MVVGSTIFAAILIGIDSAGSDQWVTQWPRLFGAGAEGAHQMLSVYICRIDDVCYRHHAGHARDFCLLFDCVAYHSRWVVWTEHEVGAFVVQDAALVPLALTYPPDQEMINALGEAYSCSITIA